VRRERLVRGEKEEELLTERDQADKKVRLPVRETVLLHSAKKVFRSGLSIKTEPYSDGKGLNRDRSEKTGVQESLSRKKKEKRTSPIDRGDQ